jgi:type I restriction enzyme S subunit
MEMMKYKISDIIDTFIAGDWGEECLTESAPNAVKCVRGADIVPIWNSDYQCIPTRYISNRSFSNKRLKVGDIIIEKSGGSPTQSTGRTAFVSQELINVTGNLVCTNFCTAFRIKSGWNPKYIYYFFQYIYNNDVFFNFEGKTSGLKNLQLEIAFDTITIAYKPIEEQNQIVKVLDSLDRKIALNRAINQNLRASRVQLKLVLNCRGAAVNGDVSRNLTTPVRSSATAKVRLAA